MNIFILMLFAAVVSGQFLDHIQTQDDCSENNQYKCHNGRCVLRLAVCDGSDDCLDGSDEAFCSDDKIDTKKCELENKFVCADQKMCIPNKHVCNGHPDCDDQSDEVGCESPQIAKNETCQEFKCGGGECISWYWVCDGVIDCGDRSDETKKSCFHKKNVDEVQNGTLRLCPDTERLDLAMFYCKDRSFCVLDHEVCDGIKDCRDGSDEGPFCANWTTQCNNAVCDDSCKPTPQGPRCRCGQAIIEVNNTCSNADYCRNIPSACSQYCTNENRSFRCSCTDEYRKEGNLCFVANWDPILYYTTEKEVRSYNIKTGENVMLTTARRPRSAVSDGIWIYWIEIAEGNRNVMRADLQRIEKSKEVFLGIGVEQPDELAIDWLGKNIYLTESEHGFIAVCTINGAVCARIRDKSEIAHPRHIALDPENGFMYWADYIKVPRIQRAKMDGTDIITLTLNRVYPPSGLSLDIPSKKVYWAETEAGISVMNFDGSGKYELVGQSIYAPNSLAVFENDVYWDDVISKLVQSISKLEGKDRGKELFKLNSKVSGISIYHPALNRAISHTCEHNSCSDLCVVTGHSTYSCLCGEDSILHNNKHNCTKSDPQHYLLVVGSSVVSKIYFHSLTKPERESAVLDVGLVQALAYNPTQKVVYIYDSFRKVIHKLYMNSFKDGIKGMFIIPDIEDIVDMAYDYYTDNLYYVEVGITHSKLEAYSIKTQRKSNLHTFEEKETPICLCVIPEYGLLMVAIYGMKEGVIRVDRFSMDGSDRFNVYQTKYEGFHVNVAYSPEEDLVFISDPSHSVIEQLHPTGTGRDHFRKLSTSVNNLAAVNKMLFWVNKFSSKLYWANLDDHGNTIGSMQLSKYAEHVQLYLTSISNPGPKQHPCMTGTANCTYLCVQKHDKNKNAFSCLCPPGQILKNNVCAKKISCNIGQLKCYKGNSCYSREKKCDGVQDCQHGEDEEDCPDSAVCSKEQYNCPYSETCIARHQLCDGRADCLDNSDEDDKYCPIRSCHSDEFMCTNGVCITNSWVCDGEPDCQDAVDERRCLNNTCEEGNFRCRDGVCVDVHLRCDGRKDCLDWSDEEACTTDEDILPLPEVQHNKLCEDRPYICASNKSYCFPESARCNGKMDCPMGEDEVNCNDFTCAPGYYQCKHWHQCILYTALCDGNNDCDDESDESKESCYYKNTLFPTPSSPMPDALVPCDDGFRCKNNKCIDYHSVCNNIRDCRDASDEGGVCSTACSNRPCHHICKPTPDGPQCSCHLGYLMDAQSNLCTDVNECEWDLCSQQCTNIIGSYICSCYEGYALRTDGHSCKSRVGNVSFVYISGNTLNSVRLHEGHNVVVHQNPTIDDMVDLDFDPKLKMLYVTTKKELIAIDEKSKILNVSNIGSPTLVASDWITGNVYVVDASDNNQSLKVCHLKKNLCAFLHKIPNGETVKALTVDPINRKLFYCTWHELWRTSNVFVSNLERSDASPLQDVRNCTGLTVDYHKRLVYIAQADGRIRKMGYNGRWSDDLVANDFHLQSPVGLQLFEDHVYSLDSNTHRISRCLTFGSKHCEARIYRVISARAFIIRHENAELSDGRAHCERCEGCDLKKECICYDELESEDTLCVGVDPSEYYAAFTIEETVHASSFWIIMTIVLALIVCVLCIYMYKKKSYYRKRFIWVPPPCCVPRRRIVRSTHTTPRVSWQFTEQPIPGDLPEEHVHIHTNTNTTPGLMNASFVNWLYSSVSTKKKECRYEPSVSVHLKPRDGMTEPLAGSSGKFLDLQQDETVVSDTESEKDVRDINLLK